MEASDQDSTHLVLRLASHFQFRPVIKEKDKGRNEVRLCNRSNKRTLVLFGCLSDLLTKPHNTYFRFS